MSRILLVVLVLAATAAAVIAYGDPDQIAYASERMSHLLGRSAVKPAPTGPISAAARSASGCRHTSDSSEHTANAT